jgi:hypothetical protein
LWKQFLLLLCLWQFCSIPLQKDHRPMEALRALVLPQIKIQNPQSAADCRVLQHMSNWRLAHD